jgi:uncharacterized protein (TIGR03437 family)
MPKDACKILSLFLVVGGFPLWAQIVPGRYTLILKDPPVSSRYATRAQLRSSSAAAYRQQIQAGQQAMISELRSRGVQVIGSASMLLNAVFVNANPSRFSELAAMPGVIAVKPVRRFKANMNAATQVINATAAWTKLAGASNAGRGVKIGIIDSGIDQTHPAFANTDLSMPPGYPICTSGHSEDCDYTNNKVIVARSYVRHLALAAVTDPSNPAAESQPDDYSPRDRMGHGTAVASAAAGEGNTGTVTFSGVAPKAWLGNYKIAGSPGVNDGPTDDVLIIAIEDALADGMDVVNLSWGSLAVSDWAGDPVALAFENASAAGMIVVAAAGNQGDAGASYPSYNSISSPSNAPSVISVGASTNSHSFSPSVSVCSDSAPTTVKNLAAQPGSSTFYPSSLGANVAPLIDITQPPINNDGLGCSPLGTGTLTGAFALIKRGSCFFTDKAAYAHAAGAVGVIFYMADSSSLISPAVDNFVGPTAMISLSDGLALKSYVNSNPCAEVMIDLAGIETSSTANYLGYFSSRGPTPEGFLKPDLVSVGTDLYVAAQDYDPKGSLYSTNRYGTASGTSFAAPIVAGAAALVQHARSAWTPAQIRSSLINSATDGVKTESYHGDSVDVRSVGSGLLNAGAAVSAGLLADPATVSFGTMFPGALSKSRIVTVTNTGSSAVTLTAAVSVSSQAFGASVSVTPAGATLPAGESATFTVALSGDSSTAAAGAHSGAITFTSGSTALLRVPYLYLLTSNQVSQLAAIMSTVQGPPGADAGILAARATDANGAPVSNVGITFAAPPVSEGAFVLKSMHEAPSCSPSSSTTSVECPTDSYGMAYAQVVLGSTPGSYNLIIASGRSSYSGRVYIVPPPTITGVADAAGYQTTVAPGSYISLFGSNLVDTTQFGSDSAGTARAPLSLDYVNVSFDATLNGTNVSYPGHLVYVSPTQVNVLVPWELQGATSAQVKVIVNECYGPPSIYGNVYTVNLRDHVPALYESSGVAAALDTSYNVITASNKASRGSMVQLFANGLGPVTNQPASGDPASSSPLSWTTTMPVVTIGGENANVEFSGLAPGYPGLYQINVKVPSRISPGTQPVILSIGGQTSRPSTLPIQ